MVQDVSPEFVRILAFGAASAINDDGEVAPVGFGDIVKQIRDIA